MNPDWLGDGGPRRSALGGGSQGRRGARQGAVPEAGQCRKVETCWLSGTSITADGIRQDRVVVSSACQLQ